MKRPSSIKTRDKILETGSEIMWLKGYNGTGIKEITDAVGIPKGSFYNYFDSKESFVIEALEIWKERGARRGEESLLHTEGNVLDRIEAYYATQAQALKEKNYIQGCFVCNMCLEMADVNEKIAAVLRAALSGVLTPLVACIREGQEKGEIRTDLEAEELASFVDYSWRGTILILKTHKNDESVRIFKKNLRALL